MEGFVKFLIALLGLVIALIPTWLWFLAYYFFSPEGFWQKFALGIAGLSLLGTIQIGFFILWLAFLVYLFED